MKRWASLLCFVSGVSACESHSRHGPDFIFNATAQRYDTIGARSYRCSVLAFLTADSLILSQWAGEAQVNFRRDIIIAGAAPISRETTFTTSVGAQEDANGFRLEFGSPLALTVSNQAITQWQRFTDGSWNCPSSLPLAEDSALRAHGFQPLPAPSGGWSFGPALQID